MFSGVREGVDLEQMGQDKGTSIVLVTSLFY